MSNINDVIRRTSALIDTSGQTPARGIQMSAIMGGGVYPQSDSASKVDDLFVGRISLTMIAVLILAAMGFYYWTREIQGGG